MKTNKQDDVSGAPVGRRVRRNWKTCQKHGEGNPNVWGCPECLRELREENARLRAVLSEYANIYNWNEDSQGIRRVWLEPRAQNETADGKASA
jgi:hypothetical protein